MTTTDVALRPSLDVFNSVPGVSMTWTRVDISDPDLPFAVFSELCRAAGQVKAATSWWIGDLCNLGEKLYGDRYVEAMELTGLSYETLTNYASVCRRVSRSRRRDQLRFGHHAEVAALEPLEQELWLDAAIANGWKRAELRERLRASKDAPAAIEQPRWKDKAPVSTEPLTPEKVEEAENDARKTLGQSLPANHPLWETRARAHARDVVALAATAKVTLREAAERLVEQADTSRNGEGVWVPREAFEAFAAVLAEEQE